MKKTALVAILIFANTFNSFSQFPVKNINGLNYAISQQIDSSDYFIIGSLANKSNKSKYNLNNGQQYDYYGGLSTVWTNVFIQNTHDKKITRVFPDGMFAVYPVYNTAAFIKTDYGYQPRGLNSGMTETYIIYLAKTDEYNKDNVLDEDDPVYLYISTKTGANFMQITSGGMNVTSWKQSKDGKTIIATIQTDKNGDKKFTDEDETIYQINLDDDFKKITVIPISIK